MINADDYLALVEDWDDPYDPPIVELHNNVHVVRDDVLPAGSKMRFIDKLIRDTNCDEWVFGGSNKVGWGPISLAYVCRKYNKSSTCFWAARKEPTWHQEKYMEYEYGTQFYFVGDKVFVELRLGFQCTIFRLPKRLHKDSLKYSYEQNLAINLDDMVKKTQQTM